LAKIHALKSTETAPLQEAAIAPVFTVSIRCTGLATHLKLGLPGAQGEMRL
jgi:hypothetical protein